MPDSLLRDCFAAEALRRIDQDGRHLKVGHDMAVGIALRAYMLDRWTEAFLQRCPEATVLHLGCGLDSRIFRIDPGPEVRWFGVDFPDVIALRRQIYPDRAGCAMIACSIVESGWIAELPADRPAMIVAEGVLPYLEEDQVPQASAADRRPLSLGRNRCEPPPKRASQRRKVRWRRSPKGGGERTFTRALS